MFPNLVTYYIHRQRPLPSSDARAYQYILAGNGLFVRAETRFWRACIPIAPCPVRGLPPLSARFELKAARLPASILYEAIRHAQQRRDQAGRLVESVYRFCRQAERVRVVRPAQTATASRVETTTPPPADTLLELHSHGDMPAFWSGTDDRDEQGACLYGVVGRLDSAPEIRLRVGVYGYWHPLALADLFVGAGRYPLRDAGVTRPARQP